MSQNVSFNLVDKPWICVRDLDGETREVSLLELFEQAPGIKCLANDLPTQDFAILRVLLAVLQRAISSELDEDDEPTEVWGSLWEDSELPVDEIRSYLDEWHHRFDLFDEEYPFMQVAGLRWDDEKKATDKENDDGSSLRLIIADVPSRRCKRLFSTRTENGFASLAFAEAARWLIHFHSFDVKLRGAPVLGEHKDSISSGKVYCKNPGWANDLGCLYLEGVTLKETLLLNFLPTLDRIDIDSIFSDKDLPSWEKAPQFVKDGHAELRPKGRADLFTWVSRWIRLVADGDCVKHAVVSAGGEVERDYQFLYQFESMTPWKEQCANGGNKLNPKKHSYDRSLWRGLTSVFGDPASKTGEIKSPDIINWLNKLSDADQWDLSVNRTVRVHAVGLQLDSQKCVAENLIDDSVELSPCLLSPEGEALVSLAKEVASSTEEGINALGRFAANLRRASGGSGDDGLKGWRQKKEAQAFFLVDAPFRAWLAGLDRGIDSSSERESWHRTARSILKNLASDLMQSVGQQAVMGSPYKNGKGKDEWMTAARAEVLFNKALKKALPLEDDVNAKKEVR